MELQNITSPALSPNVQEAEQHIKNGEHTFLDAPLSARSFIIASLHKSINKKSVAVAPSADRAQVLARDLELWLGRSTRVFYLPPPDASLYSRAISADSAEGEAVLAAFAQSSNAVLVVSASSLFRKVALTQEEQIIAVNTFDSLSMEELSSHLAAKGYKNSDIVSARGEWAKRGGIIDVFSPHEENPVRIEFFGNSVDSMRYFDVATQRSIKSTENIIIKAAASITAANSQNLLDKLRELDQSTLNFEAKELLQNDIALLENHLMPTGQDYYASLLPQQSILDYASCVYIDEPSLIYQSLEFLENEALKVHVDMVESGELSDNFPLPHFSALELNRALNDKKGLSFSSFEGQDVPQSGFSALPEYLIGSGGERFKTFAEQTKKNLKSGKSVLCLSSRAERLTELLEAEGIAVLPFGKINSLSSGTLAVYNAPMSGGFEVGRLLVVTDKELYGVIKERRAPIKRSNLGAISSYKELKEGAYVVHVDHGIGRYLGVKEMSVGGEAQREYLILEYAGEERLYVPVDQLSRIAAYIGGGAEPRLSRLSGTSWENAKKEAREAAEEVAEDLLELYAQRELSQGLEFSQDTQWQHEMEDAFPFAETADQLSAIAAIKEDMESSKPMDRLVLGDVGYGKTEVAIRAAFKAVMDGKQVAVLVPTTVLAQQHYNTFKERLSSFPVRIEVISRFRSGKEQKDILQKTSDGQLDIIIGTHRLLQKDVQITNLGLLIIDEEQRFGVRHKEHLKKLRIEIDVLSLSATPIPRTLQMSLSGVRDLSIIETPPSERLPVKTFVAPENERVIREAIMREIERQGQVFFVHNRVQSIEYMAEKIRRIVPEARVAVGHGQMREGRLEEVMRSFMAGEVDVLVSTTIIESGVDIPSANTLIVSRADTFGLTQLYQLRGRVGRGASSSYAYLLYEKGMNLSPIAAERLQTLYDASSLGAGYSIAMKDLEIRGAGNLLGVRQSGYIASVGFHMYSELLAEAVANLRMQRDGAPQRRKMRILEMPSVSLLLPSYLDENIFNEEERLDIYRRLSEATALAVVNDIADEIKDRSALLPEQTQNLLLAARLRTVAAPKGVSSIVMHDDMVTVTAHEGIVFNGSYLMNRFPRGLKAGRGKIIVDIKILGKNWQKVLEEVIREI